ncbi:MAG: response regulator [Methanoregula sp.]|nr:response regulator [Methanoregula sp.]
MIAENIRVLYVDDESTILDLCKLFLERSGDFTVTIAASAPEAIRILGHERFDTIVSDYQMPEMDGIEFLKHLKDGGNTTPFIIFTGKGREEVVIEALNAGADFYLQKGGDSKSQFAELSHKIKKANEVKRVEEAFKESEERFRSLFDSALDMIQIIRPDGSFLHINPAWKKTLGYADDEVRTLSVFDIFHPDSVAHCSLVLRELLSGAGASNIEAQFLTKNKETISVEGNCSPELKDGAVVSIRGIFHDITDRKRAEEALREANKKLNLLSSITRHDIINQLTALKGYLELSYDMIDKQDTILKFIKKEEQAANTIEAQITFTRDYQNLGAADPAWQNVNTSIKKAVAELPMRDVHVDIDRTDLEIFADPLFEKVFYNLIDNALRYGGDRMKTIRISSQKSDASLTIICGDDGGGISAEDKKHLFTRGFGKNTGLGLFLSREILSITGITIIENGVPGNGARFEIIVPKGMWRMKGVDA